MDNLSVRSLHVLLTKVLRILALVSLRHYKVGYPQDTDRASRGNFSISPCARDFTKASSPFVPLFPPSPIGRKNPNPTVPAVILPSWMTMVV
ncbi:hypothetical protein Nepgr_025200 [Nepenthes gracilis]|uniref:Secreted protein n=1 Tax=Nepenthes gracilis TaxID=150966 RepID=A0AAD3T7B8_NEPGR|nr:hypothetical protein Nepgr_025200 [Nepenthes gracilis]